MSSRCGTLAHVMKSSLTCHCLVYIYFSLQGTCALARACVLLFCMKCVEHSWCVLCVHARAFVHVLMFVYVCGSNQVFCTLRHPPKPNAACSSHIREYGRNAGPSFRKGGLRGRLPAQKDRMLFWIDQCSEPERGTF